ncbi:MAG: hypothetical protein E7536_10785 [Ruminococcaceae bacterium]|nr:hypothetical protein [Oscillospiraceae bacterium]
MAKIIAFPLSLIFAFLSLFGIYLPKTDVEINENNWNTNYPYVFVHGLMGWGEYDAQYKLMPYWGMFGGELMKKLEKSGFDCYAASVSGTASAWDRACELYAQLTGTVTDYGEAHSKEHGHDRFGKDFTGKALIPAFDSKNKINILGHSFGGATIRVFATLMAKGDEAERNATSKDEISPLFTGGKADYIYSLTTLAAPSNGTTAYSAPAEDKDSAAYDMYIDNALALNEKMVTDKNTYYFAIPCSATTKQEDGTYKADTKIMEGMFQSSADEMGAYTGVTEGGYVFDESWLENDGLVNTISAMAPSSAPSAQYEEGNVKPGVWTVMPTYRGDHMSLQGGMMKTNVHVHELYLTHLNMINSL